MIALSPSAARCSTRARACTWRRSPAATDLADLLDLDRPLGETVALVAERRGIDIGDVMVVVLDRPRHEEGIEAIREAGARVRLITDGDVSAALLAVSRPLAGRPAVGHRRHAGGRDLRRRDQVHRRRRSSAACGRATTTSARPRSTPATTSTRQLTQDDLVEGDDCFFSATGVTDGDVLQGVRYRGRAAARRPSRSSCARARARSAASTRAQPRRSCARSTGERYG